MTATRKYRGKRVATVRRPPSRATARTSTTGGTMTALQRRRMLQLIVAGTIFVCLVAWKLLMPQSVGSVAASVRDALGQDADFKAAFSAVGEAIAGEKPVGESLQEAYTAVFAPAEYQAAQAAAVMETAKSVTMPADQLTERTEAAASAVVSKQETPPAAEGSETGDAAEGTEEETLETLSSQSVVHFNSATPANVTFEQMVLGFAYASPVSGTLTSTFGYRDHPIYGEERFHYGLDIANVLGTTITAFADGTVKATGESSSLGKYLMISHANGITTLYAHCSAVTVSGGQEVKMGDKVAEMGSTGVSTGSHLHFEVMDGTTYLNPIYYVEVY